MSTVSTDRKHRGWFSSLLRTLGVVSGLAAAAIGYQFLPHYDPVRLEAWSKIEPRINQTNDETRTEAEKSTAKIKEFFAARKQNARGFATELLSFSGKWAFVKGYFSEGSHEHYIEECFERNIFSADELKSLIESSVSGYISEVQGRENQLLVAIRADLEASELATPKYLPALGNEAQFRREYEAMLERVLPLLSKDMGITVTREIVSFVGSEIAATLLLEIGASLATELGISGGILGAGASSGAVTFGVGLVAGILVDMALDWIIRQAGYDPEGEIAVKVVASLDQLERTILDGDKKTRERYDTANWDSTWSWSSSDRESASAQAKAIEAGGGLGLEHQLRHINEIRSKLRNEALKGLILTGGAQ
jgi:hypothetical protein